MELDKLPGLGPEPASRLRERGIRTTRQLLLAARRNDRLPGLAREVQLQPETLRVAIARAELGELRGIGPSSLAQLLAVGVQSLRELAIQEPSALRAALRRVTNRPPNLAILESWILQARRLQTGSNLYASFSA